MIKKRILFCLGAFLAYFSRLLSLWCPHLKECHVSHNCLSMSSSSVSKICYLSEKACKEHWATFNQPCRSLLVSAQSCVRKLIILFSVWEKRCRISRNVNGQAQATIVNLGERVIILTENERGRRAAAHQLIRGDTWSRDNYLVVGPVKSAGHVFDPCEGHKKPLKLDVETIRIGAKSGRKAAAKSGGNRRCRVGPSFQYCS